MIDRRPQGAGRHRTGWPVVVDCLRRAARGGILLDDFVEQSFLFRRGRQQAHSEPWIGILHHPPECPWWLASCRIDQLFRTRDWKKSQEHLQGLICLSEHLSCAVRKRFPGLPVQAIRHPCETNVPLWQGGNTLVQVGHTLRNTQLIYQFPACDGWRKVRLLPMTGWVRRHDSACVQHLRRNCLDLNVTDLLRICDLEFDCLLAQSVVVCELLAASANTTIVECIARATPVAVNRHPAVEEYLGRSYPMYFNEPAEISNLLSSQMLRNTHEYLMDLRTQPWMELSTFTDEVTVFVESVASQS